ncbi:MAG: hypothetical protein JWN78_155 [Bacteroidota bacterium]|nr:hypothetical protein [Bacteroidota bacterium]
MKKLFLLVWLGACLSTAIFAQDKISKGTKVKIVEIAKTDTYYDERATFLGQGATALGELSKNPEGFYSGTLEVENGRTCFFKSVKVSVTDATKRTFDSKSLFTGEIPSGTKFKILEVPSDDAYYSSKNEIEGQTGTATTSLTIDKDGYTSGSVNTDDGKSYYFYKVRVGKVSGSSASSSSSSKPSSSSSAKTPKYITGTIAPGTALYVADVSPDDSYYSDREKYIGKKGKVGKTAMTMKTDGYYAGDFSYDDGSTGYFYKAKFSKEPVAKLPASSVSSSSSVTISKSSGDEWNDAISDDDIVAGDKVEVTAISTEDSYYDDKDKYIGKKGIAESDFEYDEDGGGYGGTIDLEDGSKPYFYLAKMKKVTGSSTTTSKSSSSSSSTLSSSPSTISKGTRVVVTDVDKDDSYSSGKSTYVGKIGKVADGLNLQGTDTYSGKILFDDGTDAYFYKVRVTVLK